MTIIWCMVPKIWSATERVFVILDRFLHFTTLWTQKVKFWKNEKRHQEILSFYYPKNQNSEKMKKKRLEKLSFYICPSYHVWFLRYGEWWTQFFVILDQFLAFFTPLTTWKIKTLKNKKASGVIIILHKCTKSHDHMLHCSFYIPSPTPGSRQNLRFSGILTKKYVLFPDFYCKKVTFSPESSWKYFFQDSTSQLTS